MRERYVEDERKQEIAKNAKDDDKKRKRGEIEKGYQRKQALTIATQNKGEVELCTLECCALTAATATTHSVTYL